MCLCGAQVARVTDFGLSRALNTNQTHRSTRTFGTITHVRRALAVWHPPAGRVLMMLRAVCLAKGCVLHACRW